MTKRSGSSQSGRHARAKKPSITKTISAEEFDRLADLSPDDPAGDLEPHMDHGKSRRPGREVQRVNVDFPLDLLHAIDREATRIGVTRQAFIKLRLADTLTTK